MDGVARSTDDSYDLSVSAAQRDSGMVGLDTVGCCKVEGTVRDGSVLVVGVTEDSVGLDIVDTDRGTGICRGTSGGEGVGNVGDFVRETVGVSNPGDAACFGGSGGKSR